MEVIDDNSPNQPVKQPAKKWGCCSCGCVGFLILLVVLAVLSGGGLFLVAFGQTGKDTDVYEGTADENDVLQSKFSVIQESIINDQVTTTTFTVRELNILVAMSPDNMNLKHHLYLTSADNVIHGKVAIPIKLLISWAGNGDIPLDIDFVPEIEDGRVNLDLKGIQYNGTRLDAFTVKWIAQPFNDQLRDALASDPVSTEMLDHVETLKMENNQVVFTTH